MPTPMRGSCESGTERWLVVKTTPDQAWNICRQFWGENGFVLAIEQPNLGIMETDWAENRAELPPDFLRQSMGSLGDVFYSTYKRDKFRTRIERGSEPGTMEIYVSQRRMEQVPTVKIDNVSPAGFKWAVMPPNPGIEAEFLTRLMVKFGDARMRRPHGRSRRPPRRARCPTTRASTRRPTARRGSTSTTRSTAHGGASAWRSTASASPSSTATARRACTSSATPIPTRRTRRTTAGSSKLMFWKDSRASRNSTGSSSPNRRRRRSSRCRMPNGAPDKTPNSEKILALLKDQLK